MKFKEMSCEELKKEFKKILNQYTSDELIESLEKYKIETQKYTLEKEKIQNLVNNEFQVNKHINIEINNIEYCNINKSINEKENVVWESNQAISLVA